MNRRSFLKRIGQTIAGVVAVPSLLKGKDDGFKKVKYLRNIRAKGMSPEDFNTLNLNLPKMDARGQYIHCRVGKT